MEGPSIGTEYGERDWLSRRKAIIYRYLSDADTREALQRALYAFIRSAQLPQWYRETVQAIAQDVLGEITEKAFAQCDRYDPDRDVGAWLYGIGVNCIKQRKDACIKRQQREIPLVDVHASQTTSDDALFDLLDQVALAGPDQDVEAMEQFQSLLSQLTESDQHLLHLYILQDFGYEQLSQKLNIRQDAARKRIQRVLDKLRRMLSEQGGDSNG